MLPDSASLMSAVGELPAVGEQGHRGHDKARGAEAALKAVAVEEGLLHRMQHRSVGEAFDGKDLRPVRLDRQHQTRPDGQPVDEHRAGPAHAVFAAHVGPGQSEVVAQKVGQRAAGFDPGLPGASVDPDLYLVAASWLRPGRHRRPCRDG